MFGYVVANVDALTQEDKATYRALYCGLCRSLGERHGLWGRMMLTYDMTFLVLLLAGLDDAALAGGSFVCPAHPLKKQHCLTTQHTAYAADLSAILAYYQALDDKADDRKVTGALRAGALKKAAQTAAHRHLEQEKDTRTALEALHGMEVSGETNPDLPANAFGEALGSIFAAAGTQVPDAMRAFGWSLGRFIYLMDAAIDLKDDLKKERYNALMAVPSELHYAMLQSQMAICTALYEELPVVRFKAILDNILYSGIWTRYQNADKGKTAP